MRYSSPVLEGREMVSTAYPICLMTIEPAVEDKCAERSEVADIRTAETGLFCALWSTRRSPLDLLSMM